MPKTTDQNNTTVEREAFTLTLPEVFNIKPDHIIDLPRKWKALVYVAASGSLIEDTYGKVRVDANGKFVTDPRPYYRVRIVTPKGKRSRNFHQFGSHEPMAVMEHVQDAADKLAIKTVEAKRIRREEGQFEDEE